MARLRKLVTVLVALGTLTATTARADESDHVPSDDARRAVRVGAVGGIGFPRPLAIEPMVELNEAVALGLEYGFLPDTTIDGVHTSLWSLSGDLRVFPWRGPFFIGLRVGRQHVGAEGTVSAAGYSATETLGLDSWFVNPRIGVLWTHSSGFTLGMDLGLQIPVSPTTSSSLPLAYAPSIQNTVNTLGGAWLPTVDLLRAGMLF